LSCSKAAHPHQSPQVWDFSWQEGIKSRRDTLATQGGLQSLPPSPKVWSRCLVEKVGVVPAATLGSGFLSWKDRTQTGRDTLATICLWQRSCQSCSSTPSTRSSCSSRSCSEVTRVLLAAEGADSLQLPLQSP
jgi:hypothetical protein